MATYKELLAQKAELDAQLMQLREVERGDVIADIRQKMIDYEISIEDITGGKAKRGPSKNGPVAAKYRDPQSGVTWSGRGKPPAWIKNVENRDSFLIK
jgi:DNA-binding protein H-NS